jgi:hypothetical protein
MPDGMDATLRLLDLAFKGNKSDLVDYAADRRKNA